MFRKIVFYCLVLPTLLCAGIDTKSYIAENGLNLDSLNSTPSRVYASSPVVLYMLYALAPELISGVNNYWNKFERPYLNQRVLNEPVVGGFFGQGKIPNLEMLLRLNPELILVGRNVKNADEILKILNKPTLFLKNTSLEDYISSFEILGEVLNKKDRATKLVNYAKNALKLTSHIEEYIVNSGVKRKTIYYAQGSDGLLTECAGSWHASLIERSGAINVHKCGNINNGYGRVKVSFEQVLKYDPDIILVYDERFLREIYVGDKWKLLRAVRENHVYFIPRAPFSWFDRPPSFMRFLGLKWLINLSYPKALDIDIKEQMREFYELFLDIKLSDTQIREILGEKID